MNLATVTEILRRVKFNHWRIQARMDGDRMYLQVGDPLAACNVTNAPVSWTGRKWLLSPHMTKSEIVTTAFKAVMTAVEHETREQFLYCGASIFDPHYDVDRLLALRSESDSADSRGA